jgi:hypothetical protein
MNALFECKKRLPNTEMESLLGSRDTSSRSRQQQSRRAD